MADAVFGVLLEKLITFIQDEAHLMHEFPGHLKMVKDELLFIKSYLKDANNVKIKDRKETLKTFMQKLRELLYDVEDIIVDCEFMLQKQEQKRTSNCSMYFSPSFLMFRHHMGNKLGKINQDIKSLRESMPSYLGTALILPNQEHVSRGSQSVRYPILNDESNIVGINDDSRNVINWALQAASPLTVIGIVGMGGIGKTTLAQKIYDNNDVKQNFDHKLMVVVSQSVELREIVKSMLRKLGVKEDILMGDQLDLLRQLNNQLTRKYLVILDDVWNNDEQGLDWWQSLNSCFPKRHDGSCIIITTRNEKVARSMGASKDRIHRPSLLSKEDSWSLFTKIAFAKEEGQCPSQELEIIGNEIVAQCSGLPLTIKVVGGMMLGKEYSLIEWKRVSDHLKDEMVAEKKDDSILSTLRLSYEELPMHLKPCLMCFAAFPDDFEIQMNDVIYWWIGEGFVTGRNEMTTLEIGREWWIELISRGLLIGARKEYHFEKYFVSCRVHDMVHSMIINIAKEEHFMGLMDDRGNPSLGIQSRRHVNIMKTTTDDGLLFSEGVIPKLSRLRTFIWGNIKESEFISKLYQHKWLRVLVLQFTRKKYDLPTKEKDDRLNGIGSLRHLIYLKIKDFELECLPDSIAKPQNLQVIYLVDCVHLKRLPTNVTSLKKLTYFTLYGCDSIEYFPMGFGNLSNLQVLAWFKPASSKQKKGCCVSELRNLTQLRVLRMEIDSEDGIGEEELHVLSELKQLKSLSLYFSLGSVNDEQKEQFSQKVSYDISPCRQLQELFLFHFPGETTPAWLNPITFPNLQFLSIYGGNMRRMYPGFFGKREDNNRVVWKLEALRLYGLKELEEEWPGMERAMPSLSLFKVSLCPKLKLFPCNVEGYGNIWRK